MSKVLKIYEKERGLVPGRAHGAQDRVYTAYLTNLNPRADERLQTALAACPDPRFKEFLERLLMPKYKRVALATMAKGCNISLMEFQRWWQKESSAAAIAIAQTKSVMITQDMVEDALSRDVACTRCDGLGFIAAPPGMLGAIPGYKKIAEAEEEEAAKYIRDCPNCQAKRTLRKPGDPHARDKLLDMAGLVKKGAGVSIVQNFGGATHSSAVSELDDVMTLDITPEED